MKISLVAGLIVSGAIGCAAFAAASSDPGCIPVVLELFTSEGCSSCPPADRLLESLDRQPVAGADLIVLSEHVDYWNYLGWSDPYSSAFFSDRQRKYTERLGATVYTPQLVIDGQLQVLGSDRQEVAQGVARAMHESKFPVAVYARRSGDLATLHIEANSGGANVDLYIVVASDNASSQVLRGENGGHMLTHVAVAQSITRIGKWEGSGLTARDVPMPPASKNRAFGTEKTGQVRVIAILQDPRSGRILGAAQTKIEHATAWPRYF